MAGSTQNKIEQKCRRAGVFCFRTKYLPHMNCAFKVLRSLCEGFFEYASVLEDIIEKNIQGYWNEVNIK